MKWRLNPVILAALVLLPSAATSRADLWPVLAAHYKLDETDVGSTVVYDALGSVHGTRNGDVTIGQPGIDGTAYSFLRNNTTYVDLNRQDVLPQTGPFKLELSFKTDLTSTHYLLSSYVGTSPSRTLLYGTSGRIHFAVGGGALLSLQTPTGLSFADNQWHRIMLTREYVEASNTDLFKLYVDNEFYDSGEVAPMYAIGGGTNPNWQISGSVKVADRGFRGLIDDVRVYVPEPSSAVLSLLAAGMLLLRRRRR